MLDIIIHSNIMMEVGRGYNVTGKSKSHIYNTHAQLETIGVWS